MGFQPTTRAKVTSTQNTFRDNYPDSKIAVFWQDDDAGKDQFKGLKDGLGDKAHMIIADKSLR